MEQDIEIHEFKEKSYGMNIWAHAFLYTIQVVMSHPHTHPLKLCTVISIELRYLDPGSNAVHFEY